MSQQLDIPKPRTINEAYAVKNYVFPDQLPATQGQGDKNQKKNLSNILTPVQLQRIRQDVNTWRQGADEAERAYYPHRVRMQRLFIDTVLNGHVDACMARRKDLTLMRKFEFVSGSGEGAVVNEEITQLFIETTWFKDFMNYSLDAIFYGYSLISLGDIVNDEFVDCSIIRRWNISPDRKHVTRMIYSLSGYDWNSPEYKPWHVYVPTPSDHGVSPCGFGLLYKVGLYEIILRNVLGYNSDFVELYSQPYRVGKTLKTDESERAELEAALQNMGSAGWAVIDPTDEIQFLETALAGTGWKGYENLEARCQKTISKIILGHADAMDSTPGKLGAGQDGEESPTATAMSDKKVKDGEFLEPIINKQLLPRMRELGFRIPDDLKFRFKNDDEVEEFRQQEDASNLTTAQIAQTMKNAGLQMDPKYFSERTGIPAEKVELPAPIVPGDKDPNNPKPNPKQSKKVKDILRRFYK